MTTRRRLAVASLSLAAVVAAVVEVALPATPVSFAAFDAALEAPTNVCARSGVDSIEVSWDTPTDPAVDGHIVQYQAVGSTEWLQSPPVAVPATTLQLALTGTTRYRIRVAATAAGHALPSDWGDRCVIDLSQPYSPLDFAVFHHERVTKAVGDNPSMLCYLTRSGAVFCSAGTGGITRVGGLLTGRDVVDVSASVGLACALDSTQAVFCWGESSYGLGDGSTNLSLTPVRADGGAMAGRSLTKVVVGSTMTCALATDSSVVCWGADGTAQPPGPPRVIGGALVGKSAVDVVSGGHDACAITTTNDLVCWGWNAKYLVESVPDNAWIAPQVIDLRGFAPYAIRSVALSTEYRCVLTTDGRVGCWGDSVWGQAGVGDALTVFRPALVQGVLADEVVAELSAFGARTCAATVSGGTFCWGLDQYVLAATRVPTPMTEPITGGSVGSLASSSLRGVWNGVAQPNTAPSSPRVASVAVQAKTGTVTLTTALPGAAPVSGYVVEGSDDGGATWTELSQVVNTTAVPVTLPDEGTWHFRGVAVSSVGRSSPSPVSEGRLVQLATRATIDARVSFVTNNGHPIVGAAVAWTSAEVPNDVTGAGIAATDTSGALSLPGLRTGAVQFSLTHGTVAGVGTLTSADCYVVVKAGATAFTVVVPEPTLVTRTVTVTMRNGNPVAGAKVYVLGGGVVQDTTYLDDLHSARVTWHSNLPLPPPTGPDGVLRITGFDAPATGSDAIVVLERGPNGSVVDFAFSYLTRDGRAVVPSFSFLKVTTPLPTAVDVNAPVNLRVRAVDANGAPKAGVAVSLSSATARSAARTGCAPVLTAVTAAGTGEATLRICPTVGGAWAVTASGFEPTSYQVPLAAAPSQAALSGSHSCVRRVDGTVACVGSNVAGELGNGSPGATSSVPVAVAGVTGAGAVAVGQHFTCVLLSPGATGNVRCFGAGPRGSLGGGSLGDSAKPVQVTVAGSGVVFRGATQLDAAGGTACAVVNPGVGGQVYCWGANGVGQLADGTVRDRSRAAAVRVSAAMPLKGVVRVSVGTSSACALLFTGAVRCWGANSRGQLGNGGTTASAFAVPVRGLDGVGAKASSISVGDAHACAVIASGAARCWGLNSSGQLGIGNTRGFVALPSAVLTGAGSPLVGVTSIAAGSVNSCAITGSGTASRVRCWGANSRGELGMTASTPRTFATLVGSALLNGVRAIEVGPRQAVALVPSAVRPTSVVLAWGVEVGRELGLGGVNVAHVAPRLVSKL